MTNPIQYSSRDFDSILADLNRDQELADKPSWIKRALAGIGDVISMWLDAEANNSVLRTAFTRQAVADLCALIDYQMTEQMPSLCTVLFHLKDGVTFPVTLSAAELAASTRGTIASNPMRFEARAAATAAYTYASVNLTTNPPSGDAVLVSRDFTTGEKVIPRGSVPSGLVAGVAYYAIRVDATHVKFAQSVEAAYAGTALAISGGSGTMSVEVYSVGVVCYQQETVAAQVVATGDGSTQFLEVDLPDADVIGDTLAIEVNGDVWEKVSSLAFSGPGDKHYQHVYSEDGRSFVRFGDGAYGAIPGNFDVVASYARGGGAASNVARGGISSYAGTSASVSGATNPAAATGGADRESIERAKRIAPGLLKGRDRFVTSEDGEALALAYGGSSLVKVITNAYGALSAKVVAVAVGGGSLGPAARAALQSYLISKTILESIDVRVEAAVVTPVAVTSAAKMLPGYLWANVLPYFRVAWKLLLSESGQEIVDAYIELGDSEAVSRVNAILGESFQDADPKVVRLVAALETYGARRFGEEVQLSDAVSFVQGYVYGVDYMTVTLPSFPVALAADEITTAGALTLTEVS